MKGKSQKRCPSSVCIKNRNPVAAKARGRHRSKSIRPEKGRGSYTRNKRKYNDE